ncbi:hypothetical protein A1OE_1138 [Candidatus Endolissoclinum faulkneri L2]|uniref:Uncharacterized protein n=1 Tax=Candidatus Endolissoclinum faulkneri L2 TaxID=1193729 RepID=K7ZD93_9PROT|nr:hypothetical protein A1OE_1138 [Candidatus Endolissoclinum faulkneri L2]
MMICLRIDKYIELKITADCINNKLLREIYSSTKNYDKYFRERLF